MKLRINDESPTSSPHEEQEQCNYWGQVGQKEALEAYRNLVGYLQYENTVFWTRLGFIYVANAALLAAAIKPFESHLQCPENPTSIALSVLGVVGVLLCLAGVYFAKDGKIWIDYWTEKLIQIEPAGYGDVTLFRSRPLHKTRLRETANALMGMFFLLWIALIVVAVLHNSGGQIR